MSHRTHAGLLILAMAAQIAFLPAMCESPATKLEGGIDHQEVIEPLFSGLSPGSDYSKATVKPGDKGVWIKIPSWLSGSWLSLSALRTFRYDSKTGESDNSTQTLQKRSTESFGQQKDSVGDIYTMAVDPVPSMSQDITLEGTDGNTAVKTQTKIYALTKNTFQQTSPDRLIIKSLSTQARVDSQSNKVQAVENHKATKEYVKLGDGVIACSVDDRVFDQEGFPLYRQKYSLLFRQTRTFSPESERGNISLRSSFEKFLESTGQLDLKRTQ